ncbi:Uu.00g077690.m01.CDS01, partial [Anthostomella pinea]
MNTEVNLQSVEDLDLLDFERAICNVLKATLQYPASTELSLLSWLMISSSSAKQKTEMKAFPASYYLNKKVAEYICKSDGGIRIVVGIDLSGTYGEWNRIKKQWKQGGNNRGSAKIIVWRAKRDRHEWRAEERSTVEVCKEDGTSGLTQVECVNLRDFVSQEAENTMNATKLRKLERAVMRIDANEARKTIDDLLEEQENDDKQEAFA